MERRLAAILAADVVGYTRLMAADEEGTLLRFTELRKQCLEPLIATHRGRVFKLMGDGLLVEFASVVDAVQCAVSWQRATLDEQQAEEGSAGLRFRIGINLGDVIVEDDDVHGDGVNVAARLENLAEPGAIYISEDAHRHAKGKVDFGFEDLGLQRLKNVSEPIRVFRVDSGELVKPGASPKTNDGNLGNKPSVAVLPFKELGSGADDDDFGEGLAADVTTELARTGNILVVGGHESQTRTLEGESIKVVGRTLSVRYVLTGTIRRAGTRMRLTAELLEAENGHPWWAERFDRSLDDPFAVQDEISRAIAGVVEPTLHRAEMDRISKSPAEDLRPHELMLRAWRLSDKGFKEGNFAARKDCERAIALEPEYSDAHTQLAWILYFEALNGWTDNPEVLVRKALHHAETGWSLNPKDYDALGARGTCLIGLGRYDAATRIVEELAKRFPNHAHATMYRGDLSTSLGHHQQALELAHRSMEINPEHDHWHWMFEGISLFCLERFAEAVESLEQFRTMCKLPFVRLILAAAYAATDRNDEAKSEAGSLNEDLNRLLTNADLSFRLPSDRQRFTRWAKRAAGLD